MKYTLGQFSKQFALPLWPWYLAGIIMLALTNLITLEIPLLAKRIVNAFDAQQDFGELESVALLIIGLGILTIIIRALSRIFIFYPGRRLEETSKSYLFDRLMHLPQSFFESFGMGELISRLANDVGILRAFFAFGVLQLLNLIFLLAFTISKMLAIHPWLTVVCLTPILLMVFFMRQMMNYMHRISLANQEAVGRLTNSVTESFVNIHVIKANSAEETFLDKAEAENQDVYDTNIQAVMLRTVLFPLLGALMNLSQVTVVFYGGYEAIQGRLSIGDILAFNVYIAYLGFPLSAVGIIVSLYQRSRAAMERISAIQECQPETQTDKSGVATEAIVDIRDLSFRYSDDDQNVLSNIDLKILPGQHVGIYGSIGSGKSTLFNLMTRLLNPPEGSVYFEGRDVLSWKPHDLRMEIGYAQQTPHLFSDNIRENLRFGLDEASDAAIEAASKQAEVHTDIMRFDDQWQTEIGEKGIRLSGGQKQRLALARIFLRQPKLLVLDDTLSAVDHTTERKLIEHIRSTSGTLLIASHRVSALKHCDQILVLEEGRIKDRGSFDELKSRHAVFQNDEEVAEYAGA